MFSFLKNIKSVGRVRNLNSYRVQSIHSRARWRHTVLVTSLTQVKNKSKTLDKPPHKLLSFTSDKEFTFDRRKGFTLGREVGVSFSRAPFVRIPSNHLSNLCKESEKNRWEWGPIEHDNEWTDMFLNRVPNKMHCCRLTETIVNFYMILEIEQVLQLTALHTLAAISINLAITEYMNFYFKSNCNFYTNKQL